MKKRSIYLLFTILMFIIYTPISLAVTIRETLNSGDEYSTLEPNTFIIGVTKFSGNEVITASKASTAGANDAMLYVQKHGTAEGYKHPVIYYYIDSFVGWFAIDKDNNATPVTDTETLNKLSNLDIYYINNNEKLLEVSHDGGTIIPSSLTNGATYKDNKILVPATISKFEFKTTDGNKIGYIIDNTTSKFIPDQSICYTVESGIITNYDSTCNSNVIIPTNIDGEEIIGIGENAFNNKNIKSVIIPSNIKHIKSTAFANNNLESVIIKEKYDELDFSTYGENVFGTFQNITYDNDLTRALNLIDENFVLDVYSKLDISEVSNAHYYLQALAGGYISKMFEENNYQLNFCLDACNYDNRYYEGVNIGFGLKYISETKYELIIEKLYADTDKYYKVSKTVDFTFNKTGNSSDNNIVEEAIQNLKIDNRVEINSLYPSLNTRARYLDDIEDQYDVEVMRIAAGAGGCGNDEINYCFSAHYLFFYIDNVLYQYNLKANIVGFINQYNPTIKPEDYQDLDTYIEEVFKVFETKTGINNYEIIYNEDGSLYTITSYNVQKNYTINLIDREYNEKWVIYFREYYKDNYDETGNTKDECFIFSDGVITSYDTTCGANVVIPNQINDQKVTEIENNVFQNKGLKSIVLPDTLIKIGNNCFSDNDLTSVIIPDSVTEIKNGAFSNNELEDVTLSNSLTTISGYTFSYNKIKEINIPNTIIEIGYDAFSNNEIENLEIPKSVKEIGSNAFQKNKIKTLILHDTLESIGGGAFNDNQLSDEDAFIYARVYDYDTETYQVDNSILVSYAGANRENIVIPNHVKAISNYAFYENDINNIEIPYGVSEIGYNAFRGNKLTSISIPDTVIFIGSDSFSDNLFEGDNCFIYLSDKDGKIDYTNLVAYSNKDYYDLDTIEIPSKVKKIWNSAFSYGSVDNLIIPYGVEEIGDYAFQMLSIKNPVILPKSLKKNGKSILSSNYGSPIEENYVYAYDENGNIDKTILMAYRNSYSEKDVLTLPEGIVEIRENAFYNNMGNIKEIVLPSTLKTIGDSAFSYNYSLEKVTLNEGLENVGDFVFYNSNIDEISIPSTVKAVGDSAFGYSLDSVEIKGKSSLDEFDSLGDNPFGIVEGYTNVTFTN